MKFPFKFIISVLVLFAAVNCSLFTRKTGTDELEVMQKKTDSLSRHETLEKKLQKYDSLASVLDSGLKLIDSAGKKLK